MTTALCFLHTPIRRTKPRTLFYLPTIDSAVSGAFQEAII